MTYQKANPVILLGVGIIIGILAEVLVVLLQLKELLGG